MCHFRIFAKRPTRAQVIVTLSVSVCIYLFFSERLGYHVWTRDELYYSMKVASVICGFSILPTCLLFTTAVNTQTDNFSDLYHPLAFPPYFLTPDHDATTLMITNEHSIKKRKELREWREYIRDGPFFFKQLNPPITCLRERWNADTGIVPFSGCECQVAVKTPTHCTPHSSPKLIERYYLKQL